MRFRLHAIVSPSILIYTFATLRQWPLSSTRRLIASARSPHNSSHEQVQAARKWLHAFHADTIPKGIGELSFSRSSGPGGQNVNKYVLF
jgi:peptidyl-tRNA hydrolase ICT1